MVDVFVESGEKRVFAGAVEWPGWARSGRTEADALESLAAYRARYAKVAAAADLELPSRTRLSVVASMAGGSGTDFGVLGATLDDDDAAMGATELRRGLALLRAAWAAFDSAAGAARGVELRRGPRGGGRSLEKMTDHVLEAEEAYLSKLGRKTPRAASTRERLDAVRAAAVEALQARVSGEPVPDANRVRIPWSPRYYLRRSAWHALDHAWELEDRSS